MQKGRVRLFSFWLVYLGSDLLERGSDIQQANITCNSGVFELPRLCSLKRAVIDSLFASPRYLQSSVTSRLLNRTINPSLHIRC